MSSILDTIGKNRHYSQAGGGEQEDGPTKSRVILGEAALTEFLLRADQTKGGEFLWNRSHWAKDRTQGWGLVGKKTLAHHLNNKALGLANC